MNKPPGELFTYTVVTEEVGEVVIVAKCFEDVNAQLIYKELTIIRIDRRPLFPTGEKY